ncbi:HAD family hydrolase [Chondrinema litorale]|uniref:HAD family hydrolase n=1 Tax=Chondrinema litorale TaxID=2994555 RepID=UPI002543F5F1|nr:HAD family phosphatase [Chondrinema litorale]UZR93427.1 HAD family phosphatase [Chondrinema litorale]
MTTNFAAIFDMDGVIVDSNPFHKIALDQFTAKYGITMSEEELHSKLYGRRNEEWIPHFFKKELTKKEVADYGSEKEELFREIYKDDVLAVAGLEALLIKFKEAGIPCAVGTSAPPENADFILDKTNLRKYFQAVLDSRDVSIGKPHPDIYLKAAERLQVPPNQCIVFEDALPGVEAGLAAGAKVVGVATTHSHKELAHTDLVIDDFTNLNIEKLAQLFS